MIVIISIQPIYAQSNVYHPFAGHGANWVTNSSGHSSNCCCSGMCVFEDESKYYICGDTLIENKNYTKLFRESRHTTYITGPPVCPPGCYSSSTSFVNLGLMGFITQDTLNKKVFFRYYSSQNDQLLYDFDLQMGDTLPASIVNQALTNVVTKIDSIQINGSYRKKYWISCDLDTTNFTCYNFTSLVEGFGSDLGLFASLTPNFEFSSYGSYTESNSQVLYLCNTLHNTELLKDDEISIYPNPSSEFITINLNQINRQNVSVELYDMLGKQIQSAIIYQGSTIAYFDTRTLYNGQYLIKLVAQENVITKTVSIIK
jgi:hypothetical protein